MNDHLTTLAQIINNLSPEVRFDPKTDCDCSLSDLGVDSLDNMSLFLEVQERFGLGEIEDSTIDTMTTPALILEYLIMQTDRAA